MAKQINCECGYVARGESEDEVVARIREHMRTDHPELLERVSDEDLRGWIEEALPERWEVPMSTATFDPVAYKPTTREQWQTAAEPWSRWGAFIEDWPGEATELMLDMAGVGTGSRVLDVAAGAGGQTLAAARRVGPSGTVLATDISSNILGYAEQAARDVGLSNVAVRVMEASRSKWIPASSMRSSRASGSSTSPSRRIQS